MTIFFLLALAFSASAVQSPKRAVLYRVNLENDRAKTISVEQNGKKLTLRAEGFGRALALDANGGGIETCRTILSHRTASAKIILSLPIPQPNTPCQMMPGYVTIETIDGKISVREITVKKVSGNDAGLRKMVERLFGKFKGE